MKTNKPQNLLRKPVVKQRTGYSNSTLYNRMAEGTFPHSVKIGPRAVAWVESEVDDHITKCIAQRDDNGAVV